MSKPKLLIITQDFAVGGGTSSLSSLYNCIKDQYDIVVLPLTNEGNAVVSYNDVIHKPNFLLRSYYSNYTSSTGYRKITIAFVKTLSRLYNLSGGNFERMLASRYNRLCERCDAIISYGEGVATTFTPHLKYKNKIAWIHFEISKKPYSAQLEDLYSHFDHIVTVSDVIADGFKRIYPNLAQKVIGIHNMIDEDRICILLEENIHETFNKDEFNIVSIGRLSHVKRFSEIPRIASEVRNTGIKLHWRIIGPECDESEKVELLNNINKYSVQNCVEWIGARTNPYPYLAKSDLYVSLSSTEACPMVFIEARIAKTPIISTNFNTSYEFIENDIDGMICSLEEIPEAIVEIASNKERYNEILNMSNKRVNGNTESLNSFNQIVNKDENQ